MAKRVIRKRLGEVLLERGLLNRTKLEEALAYQKQHGGVIGQVLTRLGFVTEQEVALALTAQYGFPYLPLENYEIDEGLTVLIPKAVAQQHCLIPVDRIGNALTLAMADPSNTSAIEEIELLTKCVIQTFVSAPSDIERAIEKYYKPSRSNAAHASPKAAGEEGTR